MKSRLFYLFLFVSMFSLSSCKKDLVSKLEGKWDVTSYLINGDETMGDAFTSITLQYNEATDNKGSYTWNFEGPLFGTGSVTGTYEVNEETSKITQIDSDGDSNTIDLSIDGDNLQLNGTDGSGNSNIMVAKRN